MDGTQAGLRPKLMNQPSAAPELLNDLCDCLVCNETCTEDCCCSSNTQTDDITCRNI
ncbi:hypothetical protein DPMN_068544 [Dreissena polymorpha]|uniref:Uncharacterized protein n=1 Tax=Dreissena polymorpha TaxID=45954 RepID=A0A9D4BUA6_DREPO|nr:hypothetical protein DPMN_068544 [Dreissena polymorpha]